MPRSLRPFRIACAAVLSGLALACHDGTGPGQRLASVVISGAPADPLLVGSTVQLVALPEDAHGDTLSDPVTWESSDPAVATVNAAGLVTGISAGLDTVSATSGGRTSIVPLDFRVGGTVGPSGGRVSVYGDSVTIDVPRGALSRSSLVLFRAVTPTADPYLAGGRAYELSPTSLTFQQPASLSVAYDRSHLPAGVSPTSLVLGVQSGGSWSPVFGSTVDTATGRVSGRVLNASVYAVIWRKVARVTISGMPAPDSLYVGETVQATAVPWDSASFQLGPRSTTWTSSNPSIVTVDSTGRVKAIGAGTATITATVDGKFATADVAVSAALVVDWSRATDWSTWQGDASHDGYVPVTMNPRRFHELWTVTPFDIGPLSGIATGDSTVVVTQSTGEGALYRMAVLNVATGATRWIYDFGDDGGVDAPAYVHDTIYVQTGASNQTRLWSFDAATGVIRFRAAYGTNSFFHDAPVVVGQSVYTGFADSPGGVTALSTVDGTPRWTFSSPYVPTPTVRGGVAYIYVPGSPAGVTALDASTGAVSFTIADSAYSPQYNYADAAVLGGSSDLVVANGGRLVSFDLTGRRIGWAVPGSFRGTPAVANGTVWATNGNRLEARAESDGSLQWSWTPPSGTPGNCIVSDNVLFVSTAYSTYAFDLTTHLLAWSYPVGGVLALNPQGRLLIAQSTGKLTAIALQ